MAGTDVDCRILGPPRAAELLQRIEAGSAGAAPTHQLTVEAPLPPGGHAETAPLKTAWGRRSAQVGLLFLVPALIAFAAFQVIPGPSAQPSATKPDGARKDQAASRDDLEPDDPAAATPPGGKLLGKAPPKNGPKTVNPLL